MDSSYSDEEYNDELLSSAEDMQISEELANKIETLLTKYRTACKQVLLLNEQIEAVQCRYDRARTVNRRSFQYSLQLRIATLEEVRNAFYHYASGISDDI